MKVIERYCIPQEEGVMVTEEKPEGDYTVVYRLVADEGKILTDGIERVSCLDTDKTNGWTEIDK